MISTVLNVLAPLVKRYEGLRLSAYLCPAGIPTIGYGHTRGVALGQTITEQEADALLEQDMTAAVLDAVRLCPVLAQESPTRLAAVADFTFNLGAGRLKASTLRRRINAGEYDDVPYELRRWVRAGPNVLAGLVARRESEVQLWLGNEPRESTIGNPTGITGMYQDSLQYTGLVAGFGMPSRSITYRPSRQFAQDTSNTLAAYFDL